MTLSPQLYQRLGAATGLLGLLWSMLSIGTLGPSLGLMTVGVLLYSWGRYGPKGAGIQNNGVWHNALTNRGLWGWALGLALTAFYVHLLVLVYGLRERSQQEWWHFLIPKLYLTKQSHPMVYVWDPLLFAIVVFGEISEVPSQPLSDISDSFGDLFPADLCLLAPEFLAKRTPRPPILRKTLKICGP